MVIEKILYFSGVDICQPSGRGINEREFIQALAKKFGKNAWVVVPTPADKRDSFFEQINVTFAEGTRARNIGAQVSLARWIAATVRANGIDLVVTRIVAPPITTFLLQWVFACKVAVKTLGWRLWEYPPSRSWQERLYILLDRLLKKAVLAKAVAIDTPTMELFDTLLARGHAATKIRCIQNAANVERFRPTNVDISALDSTVPPKEPVLGFVGATPSQDGARQLVEVAARLLPEFPDLGVVIAGSDNAMESVMARAGELKLDGCCHFLGQLPYESIPSVINMMDIGFSFVDAEILSKTGNSSQKVRQYLACGKPVISVPEGHEFLAKNDLGSLADPDDIDGIERAVRHWLSRLEQEGEAIRIRLRAYAEAHLSTDLALEERLAFWTECLNAKST